MPFFERAIVLVHLKKNSIRKYRKHTNTHLFGVASIIPITTMTKLYILCTLFLLKAELTPDLKVDPLTCYPMKLKDFKESSQTK